MADLLLLLFLPPIHKISFDSEVEDFEEIEDDDEQGGVRGGASALQALAGLKQVLMSAETDII